MHVYLEHIQTHWICVSEQRFHISAFIRFHIFRVLYFYVCVRARSYSFLISFGVYDIGYNYKRPYEFADLMELLLSLSSDVDVFLFVFLILSLSLSWCGMHFLLFLHRYRNRFWNASQLLMRVYILWAWERIFKPMGKRF